jgi:hypothetical protein
MRQDLLALTLDDLITLSNRGLVKRAQQELQNADLKADRQEDEIGNLTITWSDEIRCHFPSNTALAQSQCSCPATSICRHLLRSVLLYQSENTVSNISWNPGTIADEVLQQHYSKSVLTKLRSQFASGQVISVTTGPKPIAHLHNLSLNLRFLVPDDIRYTHCDCNETAPCSHIPLAIWAFQQLPRDRNHSLISTGLPSAIAIDLLDDLETHLTELADCGIAGINQNLRDRFARLEQRCRQGELIWIAEILLDLLNAFDYYRQHDAQFDIEQVVQNIAELFIRSDALRNHKAVNNPIPQLFIQGTAQDSTTTLGSARLIGLGCGVTLSRKGATLTAYLQDTDSGTVVAIPRHFSDPSDGQPAKDFHQLAETAITKGFRLGAIGSGQLLIKGAKRTPSYRLIPGRAPISLNPQSFQWEKLRSPLLVTDFTELTTHLQDLPPAELRPRHVTERLHVLEIAAVESVEFDRISQTLQAIVTDKFGNAATIIHPYSHRGRHGVEAAIAQLSNGLKYVSAQVSLSPGGLLLEPIAFVFESGPTRHILQPWIAPPTDHVSQPITNNQKPPTATIPTYISDLTQALQDLWLVGLARSDHHSQWQQLQITARAIGFHQLLPNIDRLTETLSAKPHTLNWTSQSAQSALINLTNLCQLARSINV